MHTEQELTPDVTSRLDGSPLLVLAPHPDDEVFGCGGVLAQAAAVKARIKVVILTDGQAQGDGATRRKESCEAARRLQLPKPEFWGLEDRTLSPNDPELAARLGELLVAFAPRLILVPSPAEIHPDHRALALLTYHVMQAAPPRSELARVVSAARLVAYEVSAVLRPNLLVDITPEWDGVLAAAKAFASQLQQIPYIEVLQARVTARRLTLGPEVAQAEGYHVVDARFLRTHAASEWAAQQGPSACLEKTEGSVPIDVVVRTRNRAHLLREALSSVLAQYQLPANLIVVNDGGEPVDEVCEVVGERCALKLLQSKRRGGRARAAQRGLKAARASHVVFLDDDDRLFPEHLLTLGRALAKGALQAYTDAVQGLWRSDGDGGLELVGRHRTFGGAFDATRLALVNYIPLPTVAIPRELALEVGGFDPQLELYEDWDLLLRLAKHSPLVHIPRVTVEYRVIEEAVGITGAYPPGSPGQLAALQTIWRRSSILTEPDLLARAVMDLVQHRDQEAERARALDEQLLEQQAACDGLRAQEYRLNAEINQLRASEQELGNEVERLRELGGKHQSEQEKLYTEIKRLTEILETIYASRTWQLHQLMERLKLRD